MKIPKIKINGELEIKDGSGTSILKIHGLDYYKKEISQIKKLLLCGDRKRTPKIKN